MESFDYPMPLGVHAIPQSELDLRPDAEIDALLLNPTPVPEGHEKNVWFFWDSGYAAMPPYAKRTVRTYHRRLAARGWTTRVLDVAPGSPGNVAHFVDVTDPALFPQAFREGTIEGKYARQHMSDLVRWPLLLRYGGAYADVGLMLIGDLDWLWCETVGRDGPHPDNGKRYEVLGYHIGPSDGSEAGCILANYFLCARRNNPLFLRCHRLFIALWNEDGGRRSTEGMHRSPLLQGVPLFGNPGDSHELQVTLSDYIAQGQVIRMAIGNVDDVEGWDGPKYLTEHVYTMDYMVHSQLINEMTAWNGRRAFQLMSLRMPGPKDVESVDQKAAREIVNACLSESFAFKLAHGLILAVLGDTLGSLWRKHEGSDDVPWTYGHWLRYGMIHWSQDKLPQAMKCDLTQPYKRGRLLEAA